MNKQALVSKKNEWEAFQRIIDLRDPNDRWTVLQIWLKGKGDWQKTIRQVITTQNESDCLVIVTKALGLTKLELALFDPTGQLQNLALGYILALKRLYLDRASLDSQSDT